MAAIQKDYMAFVKYKRYYEYLRIAFPLQHNFSFRGRRKHLPLNELLTVIGESPSLKVSNNISP